MLSLLNSVVKSSQKSNLSKSKDIVSKHTSSHLYLRESVIKYLISNFLEVQLRAHYTYIHINLYFVHYGFTGYKPAYLRHDF